MTRLEIRNVHLAFSDPDQTRSLYHVICEGDIVQDAILSSGITEHPAVDSEDLDVVDGDGGLLLPSLCHSHIHLDKCYILGKGMPLKNGDFQEALEVTSRVKRNFVEKDLHERGTRLIRESVENGVTSMRAHVEVDRIVGQTCVEVGMQLRKEWEGLCDVQIALFMQEPIFDEDSERTTVGENAAQFLDAIENKAGYTAIGSAPYVECGLVQAQWNIQFILELSCSLHVHADFHLDYNLSPSENALIYYLIDEMNEFDWVKRNPGKIVTVGHATRLTLLGDGELHDLKARIKHLPIHFVGLPQSDLYMMGRGDPSVPRGTLRIPQLIRDFGFNAAMAVNNVENAFTPQGAPDPLSLCPLGVAVYQAATDEYLRALVESVTINSKRAIGELKETSSLIPTLGSKADFVVLHKNDNIRSAALIPCWDRTTIKSGKVVAKRTGNTWIRIE